jgi:hypothetical protein
MATSLGVSGVELVGELEDCCGSVLVRCCCQKLVTETWQQFGKLEEGERPLLEAVTRRLVKTQQTENSVVN